MAKDERAASPLLEVIAVDPEGDMWVFAKFVMKRTKRGTWKYNQKSN